MITTFRWGSPNFIVYLNTPITIIPLFLFHLPLSPLCPHQTSLEFFLRIATQSVCLELFYYVEIYFIRFPHKLGAQLNKFNINKDRGFLNVWITNEKPLWILYYVSFLLANLFKNLIHQEIGKYSIIPTIR